MPPRPRADDSPESLWQGFIRAVDLPAATPDVDGYPFSIPAVRVLAAAGTLKLHPRVTFLVGENGSGKSTLIEAIAVAAGLNPEGGSNNFRFATRETHSALARQMRLVRNPQRATDGFFMRAESFYNVASAIEAYGVAHSYGGRSLHEMSHGESFLALANHRLREHGFYVFDEPEAALSPARQLSFLAVMRRLVGPDQSQLLIATHSPILLAYPDALIYRLSAGGIETVTYEETEHYWLTRDFLDHRERYLAHLFDDR